MELKTLKNIVYHRGEKVEVKKLKAEAVKWYHRSDDNKHKFIMEFFNITEAELVEKE